MQVVVTDQPLVTAILCTYNREAFLKAAIESILNQTYPHMEVIIVDDASTNPGMFKILESFGDQIRVIRREKNSGTCELSRYQGVQEAQGKYCAFLDSDDLWLPEKISRQVRFMEEHPDIPLCHTGTWVIDDEDKKMYLRHEGALPPTGPCGPQLLQHCFVSISSAIVRSEAWLAAQREEEIIHLGMEWDFLLTIARDHSFGYIPEPLASYRHSAEGITQQDWRWTPRDSLAYNRIWAKGLWKGIVRRSQMVDITEEALLENADYHRGQGRSMKSIYFVLAILRRRPFSGSAYNRLGKAVWRLVRPLKPKA